MKDKVEYISFNEGGIIYMQCKACLSTYVPVSDATIAVTCSACTVIKCLQLKPIDTFYGWLRNKPIKGRPSGWHFMKEFVDKDGNVFHKGNEQPDLKGTLEPTKIKPRKKKKKKNKKKKQEQTLFERAKIYKEKQKAKKKAKKLNKW